MFRVLSDPAIYEFENLPPESVEYLTRRYECLQSRGPDKGRESWLNRVVRLPSGELAGYVQATIQANGSSYVAYELGSRHWRQGIGSAAVQAMLEELREHYQVHTFIAVLKAKSFAQRHCFISLASLKPPKNKSANIEMTQTRSSWSNQLTAQIRPDPSFQ